MLDWEHSGFSVDGSVKVAVGDYGRLRRLVRYLARPAVSAERVAYDQTSGTVTVRSSKKVRGYSVRSRAERRRRFGEGTAGIRSEKPPPASERRRRWAELIRLVYEVDPLCCEKCGGGMKVVSFISTAQSEVIRRILEHQGVSTVVPRAHGPPGWVVKCERNGRAAPCREEEAYSQAPPDWDEWEPA